MRKIVLGLAFAAGAVATGLASPASAQDATVANAGAQTQPACNSGPYIVFFDWDKSTITPEAATILDSAIAAYGNCKQMPIKLAGHADRSGSDQYNMDLSSRRDDSVRAYLTDHGLPDGAMTGQAYGETMPRVATADGVREAQNRRVEITFAAASG
jgi:outer membrane protein OmpA-like peptidoglycan-associated protein